MGKRRRTPAAVDHKRPRVETNLIINFSTTIYVSMFFVLSVERMCSIFTLSMTVTSNMAH